MLSALLQTIANLGFDSTAVSNAFNAVLDAIRGGDVTSLDGIGGIFTNVIAVVTGLSSTDITTVISSLVTSVVEILSNDSASAVLSSITGA